MMRNEPLQPVMVEEPFRLTREEQEFVRKCLSSQLWRNELPWSFATGFLARMAMKAGYIKYSKVTLFSSVLGAFVFSRAVSYGTCFQKLVQQPGNTVAERMNQKKRIISNQAADRSPNILQAAGPDSGYAQQPNYLDVDINKPDYPGLDPSTPNSAGEAVPPPRPGQSYADLRRQNREAYQQQFRGPSYRPPAPPPSTETPPSTSVPQEPPSSSPYESSSYSFSSAIGSFDRPSSYERHAEPREPEKPPNDAQSRPRRVRTNKYGDVWEE